jgi:hypothetical protein
LAEIFLHSEEGQAWDVVRIELDENVGVAVGSKVVPKNWAEERQLSEVMLLAK